MEHILGTCLWAGGLGFGDCSVAPLWIESIIGTRSWDKKILERPLATVTPGQRCSSVVSGQSTCAAQIAQRKLAWPRHLFRLRFAYYTVVRARPRHSAPSSGHISASTHGHSP